MNETKKFALDVSVTFLASLLGAVLGFVITTILARYLGPNDLGLYRMTLTIFGITMLFAAIGIPSTIIKFVAEFHTNKPKINQIVSAGIILSLILGIVFTVLCYVFAERISIFFMMPGLGGLLRFLSPVFPFALVYGVLVGFFNGLRKMKIIAFASLFQSFIALSATVILLYSNFGISAPIIGLILSFSVSCIFLLYVGREYAKIAFVNFVESARKLLHFGFQLFSAGVINDINNELDVLLIGFFLTSTDVGFYAVAIALSKFFFLIPFSFQRITYPATSSYWSENNLTPLKFMIDKSMKYCTIILVILGLFVGFYSSEIIAMLFGVNFGNSVLPLQILIIGTVIRGGMATSIGGSIAAIGRPHLIMVTNGVMMIINFLLNITLIPLIGITGAAIATTASLLGGTILNLFLITKYLEIPIDFKWYLKFYSLALLGIIIYIFGNRIVNPIFIGFFIIFVLIILIHQLLLTDDDKKMIKTVICSYRDWM